MGRLLLAADGLSYSLRMTFAQALTEMDGKPISTENGFSLRFSFLIVSFEFVTFSTNKKLVVKIQKERKN